MTDSAPKINTVVLFRGGESARFPVIDEDDARGFIADMIVDGFRAGHVGDEVHLFAPDCPPIPPLPKVVTRGLGRVPARKVPVSAVVPTGPNVVPLPKGPVSPGADVVSLADYRDRRRSRRDVLEIDGGVA